MNRQESFLDRPSEKHFKLVKEVRERAKEYMADRLNISTPSKFFFLLILLLFVGKNVLSGTYPNK